MGWAGGSELAERLWLLVREHIESDDDRRKIALEFIDAFEDEDCDTIDEAENLCADAGKVADDEDY